LNAEEFNRLGLRCNFAVANSEKLGHVFCAMKECLPGTYLVKRCSGTDCIFMRLLWQTDGFYHGERGACGVCREGRLIKYIDDLLSCRECGRPHRADGSVFTLIEWERYLKDRDEKSGGR